MLLPPSRRPEDDTRSPLDKVASIWPRCGVCHKPMRFVGQFDLGLGAAMLHYITCDPLSSSHADYRISGMGTGKNLSDNIVAHWWYVFLCPQSGSHFDNPNYDAQILRDWRFGSSEGTKEEEFQPQLLDATYHFMDGIGELPGKRTTQQDSADEAKVDAEEAESTGPEIELMKITGFKLGFDLDHLEYGYDPDDTIREAMESHPEVFGGDSDYTLFGCPASQQEPKRFYAQWGNGMPMRMSPVLSFTDHNRDMTYQLYGDMWGDSHDVIYCKVDASCT